MPDLPVNEARLYVDDAAIHIQNRKAMVGKPANLEPVFAFTEEHPVISVFEDQVLIRRFQIDPVSRNPPLKGQFFHSSIRILENSGVMIDGIVSKTATGVPGPEEPGFEGVRFQPFFLSDKPASNTNLIGKGLFDRGLHFRGNVTPTTIRNVCICDNCSQSFTIQHFHAGFSALQYFYSSDGSETLVVPYGAIAELPAQLQKIDNPELIQRVDLRLPFSGDNPGNFRYYNPFRCPFCQAAFIDFERYPEIRPGEYYGNTHLNRRTVPMPRAI